MKKLDRTQLYSLEEYAEKRTEMRARVMAHKQNRRLAIGPHATLYFEDRETIHYQVQEMLRVEKVFEASGIKEELEAYNPLIPDGSNWKATFMLEYDDEEERRVQLAKLLGVDQAVWMRIGKLGIIRPISNEDLERETEKKTSAVHFLRFELEEKMVQALKSGDTISAGIDHQHYSYSLTPIPANIQTSLTNDLD
ncbi:MAG: DUF3501 family protein [Gammaproteobacteria bacterium]|nr:DUF3501 family protein [Gammaproteobacteria bacterium]